MDNKDKDNPGGGSTDADPSLSNKVNLDGSSANDNPGSRDFNTLHQLASSNTKASRVSLIISVTKAPLNEPTGAVMNTTLDKVSFGTPLMDDPGGDVSMDDKDKNKDKVNLDGSSANDNPGSRDFNTLHQLASSNTKASRFSLIISVTKAPLNEPTIEVMNTTMD